MAGAFHSCSRGLLESSGGERCLAAGMETHPIDVQQLYGALAKYARGKDST